MFASIPATQIAVLGRDGFTARRGGVDTLFRGIWTSDFTQVSVGKNGMAVEISLEAVSLLTTTANAIGLAAKDRVAPPQEPDAFREIRDRRDDGWGMTMLLLRRLS